MEGKGREAGIPPGDSGGLGPAPTSPSTIHALLAPFPSRTGRRSPRPSSPSAEAGQSPQTRCRHLWHSLVVERRGEARAPALLLHLPHPSRRQRCWGSRGAGGICKKGQRRGGNWQLTWLSPLYWMLQPSLPQEKNNEGQRVGLNVTGIYPKRVKARKVGGESLTWYQIQ